ncbi:MAG: sensor histidine kinase KdpD [Polyangiaceae bacterium]
MDSSDPRPDPEALLRRLAAERERETRTRFKIYFGFAPGVGKTFSMLEAARRLVSRGTDVVVGAVETHGRTETAALVDGLEVLPRATLSYRGKQLEEFDLDAAIRRKPAVLLLDELAHTNVAGSRHQKRWQDVLELLDNGVEVHTTLNVQHVESLNDVVAQITHVEVRETVPDAVLDRADEIELVDISPEELLARLDRGKVYLPDQAARAAKHFFRRGNLLALRELALRRTAERVDADVRAYREEQGVEAAWPASERILVMVGPAPASARLVRATRRLAAGLRAPWIAAYVDATNLPPLSDANRARLAANLKLAEALGANLVRLTGSKVSEAILEYARKHHVTKIILGKPTHSRLRDFLRGSVLDEVVRGSGDIDVHVLSGLETSNGEPVQAAAPPAKPRDTRGYASAGLLVVATLLVALGIERLAPIPDVEMLFLLAVMLSSRFGRGPSILAAALSVAAYDFFFVPPRHTFIVADTRYFLTFAMMFGIGLLLSTLMLRVRQNEAEARLREADTRALYSLSRSLGGQRDARDIATTAARETALVFGGLVAIHSRDERGALARTAIHPPDSTLDPSEATVAAWAFEYGRAAGLGTETLPGATALHVPLRGASAPVAVLSLVPEPRAPLSLEQRSLIDAFARHIALALERAVFAEQARQATILAKAEEMRSSLLSSVSHDLRTPLAGITGAATTLRDEPELASTTRAELLGSICTEAERLERLVANLLDMTRLDSGEVRLRREWLPIEEPIGSALVRLEKKLAGRRVTTRIGADVPLVSADATLLEQLFFNLLENAAEHTPDETELTIEASQTGDKTVIEVSDRGPGIPVGAEARIFERFFRTDHSRRGVGLGLAICKAIATVHGGTLVAANRPGGGATFTLTLPSADSPPPPLPASSEPS